MPKIVDIIKYEGDNSTFIWKHPREDFNTTSQLIVHESQEALFMMNGQALDLLGPGRHTLETQNIPIIGKAFNLVTGGVSPFHCEVYFINKTEQMAIKWGTNSKIQFMEPTYQFPIEIGASGEMSLRAEDSRKLLLKIVGTENILTQNGITRIFRAFLMSKVKSYIAQIIREQKISIFEIDERLDDMSAALHQKLYPDFMEYGVALERFFVTMIVKPDGDTAYEKFKSLHFRQYADVAEAQIRQRTAVIEAETRARQTVIESQALATKRQQEGYTYQQERGFDVAQDAAKNEAVGQFTNMGVGLGTMAGVGGAVGGMVGGAVNNAFGSIGEQSQSYGQQPNFQQTQPQKPSQPQPSEKNQQAGEQQQPVHKEQQEAPRQPKEASNSADEMATFKAKLDKITMMKDAGILSDEEFNNLKQQLLADIL